MSNKEQMVLRMRLEETSRGSPDTGHYVPVYTATIEVGEVPGVSNESEEDAIKQAVANLRAGGRMAMRFHLEKCVSEFGMEYQDPRTPEYIEVAAEAEASEETV